MTPLLMAKAECANFEPDGSCLGIGRRHHDKCLLAAGARCSYFEETVLKQESPIGIQIAIERNATVKRRPLTPKTIDEWDEAKHEYCRSFNVSRGGRLCPECRVRPLDKGKQFCQWCAEARRKKLARERQAKNRKVRDGVSREVSKNPSKMPEKQGVNLSFLTPPLYYSALPSKSQTSRDRMRDGICPAGTTKNKNQNAADTSPKTS